MSYHLMLAGFQEGQQVSALAILHHQPQALVHADTKTAQDMRVVHVAKVTQQTGNKCTCISQLDPHKTRHVELIKIIHRNLQITGTNTTRYTKHVMWN